MSDQEYRSGVVRKFMTGPVSYYIMPFTESPIIDRTPEETEHVRVLCLRREASQRASRMAVEHGRAASSGSWGDR